MSQLSNVSHCISAATATTVGAPVKVAGAERVSLVFKRSDHSAGSSTFTVDVSVEETPTTWIAYNKLITNVTNTNAQTLTRVASVALNSNTASLVSLSPEDSIKWVRVTATEVTDGTHDAWVHVDY